MLCAGQVGEHCTGDPEEPAKPDPGPHTTLPAAHCGDFSAQLARLFPSPCRGVGRWEGKGPAEATCVGGCQHSDSGSSISRPSSSPAHALPGRRARGKNMWVKAQVQVLVFLSH